MLQEWMEPASSAPDGTQGRDEQEGEAVGGSRVWAENGSREKRPGRARYQPQKVEQSPRVWACFSIQEHLPCLLGINKDTGCEW